ncbi:alpha/beta hydrolase fold domain-containing protein [Marinobacter sp.]|uniref:alpha/beta hydrolase fold domain-containing protein n=1 Tax=Marinobacter sp. TaxID=50741 RepID=UPI0034A4D991
MATIHLKPMLACLLAWASLSGCASHHGSPDTAAPTWPDTSFELKQNLSYTPEDWPAALNADLYLPERRHHRKHPVVLLVHGGGWERRSREDMSGIAEDLASRGFAVMNIDYRFAPDHTFPAQLHDLQTAMHWLHDNSEGYGLSPDHISAFGFSSGAHLVTLMALVASSDSELNEPHGGPHTRPVAVVAGGIPSDLRAFGSGKLIRQFLGGEQNDMPDTYRQASPIVHVSPDAPPFFLFHGAMDMLVPVKQARWLREELTNHQVPTEFYEMHLRGHITSFLTSGTAVDRATDFLLRHGVSPLSANRSAQTAAGSGRQ